MKVIDRIENIMIKLKSAPKKKFVSKLYCRTFLFNVMLTQKEKSVRVPLIEIYVCGGTSYFSLYDKIKFTM